MITTSRLLPAAILLLVSATAASCDQPTNTLPLENFPDAAAWRQSIVGDAKPAIILAASQPVVGADAVQRDVRFLLVNPTEKPIEYLGYTVDSWSEPPPAGEIHPFYRREALNDAGEWRPDLIGRCGTGKGTMRVPPGHAGEFVAHVSATGKSRVGLVATTPGATGPEPLTLLSPEVGPSSEEVPAKAP